MALFFKKGKDSPRTTEAPDLALRLKAREERLALVEQICRTLLIFMKDFSLEIAEIDAAGFRDDIDAVTQRIVAEDAPRTAASEFAKRQRRIGDYIGRQKSYLHDREKELRDIIDLLSKAIASLNVENRLYNDSIYTQTERMESITRLDDIKKIKAVLKDEIDQMRTAVRAKQVQENRQAELLSQQVHSLQGELEKVKQETLLDGLTGVYNRRAFDIHLRECVERSTVMSFSFSLLLLDIDDFKQINDPHGHLTGDRVLVSLIHKCRQFIRGEDMAARYGGEEFAIVLPGASLRNAIKKARHIRKAVAATRYASQEGEDSPALSLTISIGVCTMHRGDSATALVERADRALYLAKHLGKNRVVSEKELR